ncbi:hypothetical protein PVL29_017058 [Vitis rotundifolia]|uniref:Myb-like domain-containing protein n=1 Tax=Vitis rotundifolia TaxID=103349 RepID=A0AA38Z9G3_VITRO|nr:hypothetical protein PVL29_017058 [Vitis rotundifolia]
MKKADQDLCSNQAQTILHYPRIFIPNPLTNYLSSSPSILISLSLFFLQSEPLKYLLLRFALSLLLGPYGPSHLTAGNIRDSDEPNERPPSNRRPRLRKVETATFSLPKRLKVAAEESDWVDGDVKILKKQLLKHPVGMPGRWEAVPEAFQGRHGVESVIRKAKFLGERKLSDSDSFNRFLKDRKPVDKCVEDAMAMENGEKEGWSSGEDIALLNALKAFPKDVPMRSKAACMKRFSELKKDFRNSKAAAEE